MHLTQLQLRAQLPVAWKPVFADATYAKPTLDWVKSKFYPKFWEHRIQLGLRPYTRRSDQDNFARSAAQFAQDCYFITPEGPKPNMKAEGLAFGEIWYAKADGSGHRSICVVITEDQGLIFMEPQNGNIITLTQSEILSVSYARF
jgi:hypothetical protein